MALGYVIKPEFSNHKIIGCPSLFSAKNLLIINIEKNVNKLEESRVRCQRFHSYFHHILCNNKFYSFDSTNPRWKYSSFLTHRLQSVEQVPPPLLICLDDTWDTTGSHKPVCFSHPGAGSGGRSIKICFCQRGIQPKIAVIFLGTARSIEDFINKPTNMMCSCS